MNEPIKVGDLVMLVRGHSCAVELIGGIPFRVTETIEKIGGGWHCNACGARNLGAEAPYGAGGAPRPNVPLKNRGPYGGLPVTWLKRIPPISELENEHQRKEITA